MILIGVLGSVYYFGYYKPLRAELIEKARQLEEIDSRMYYNPNGENRSEESIKAIEEELIAEVSKLYIADSELLKERVEKINTYVSKMSHKDSAYYSQYRVYVNEVNSVRVVGKQVHVEVTIYTDAIRNEENGLIDRKFGSRMNLIFEKHNSEWYIVKEDIKPIV